MQEKETLVLAISAEQPETAVLRKAAQIIKSGGLVAFPTETVYGLGANALDETAVRAIFTAKRRPAYDPIIVHVASIDALSQLATEVPPIAYQLAEQFWPGPLTLILPKSERVPNAISADGPTVAVRCPSHPVARGLIEAAGTPIGAPSANRFSHTSPTTAQHVWHDLNGRIDLILDGGSTQIGVESTVLDITQPDPVLLRHGGVTVEMLTAVLPNLQIPQPKPAKPNTPQRAPGQLDRHYAPQTPLWLITGTDQQIRHCLKERIAAQDNPKDVGLLLAHEDATAFEGHEGPVEFVGALSRLDDVAQNLFYALRHLDAQRPALILARDYPETGIGRALHDRLRRAADRHIVC